jgi:effector-binding domain-containing protein
MNQLYRFETINAMRIMQIPLEEIKSYFNEQNPMHCANILEVSYLRLEEQKKIIEKTQNLIRITLEETKLALKEECNRFEIVDMAEEGRYFVYKFPYRAAEGNFALEEARKLLSYCRNNFYNATMRVTEFVMPKNVNNGTFDKTYGAFRMAEEDTVNSNKEDNIFIRPKGLYATVVKHSNGYNIPDIYRELKIYAEENGYYANGIAFSEDLMNQMIDFDRSNYLIRSFLQVAKRT